MFIYWSRMQYLILQLFVVDCYCTVIAVIEFRLLQQQMSRSLNFFYTQRIITVLLYCLDGKVNNSTLLQPLFSKVYQKLQTNIWSKTSIGLSNQSLT